ncbi:hypothetical protein BD560DRAFT_231768 [Blakeslea trispora]|nr:hypothetical protein BD560DRAFT_231768 [Blakeslea trispora]
MTLWSSRKLKPMMTLDDVDDNLDQIYTHPLIIVVAGTMNVGKSTFIRLGLQNLISKHDSNRPDLQCHHTNIVLDQNNYPVDVIESNSDQLNMLTHPIHGGFVCYDATDHSSVESIPELLAFFTSRSIPVYLVGLKSDLDSSHQVNSGVGDIKHYRVSAFSENGAEQIHTIFMLLFQNDLLLPDDYPKEVKTRPSTWHSMLSIESNARESLTAEHVGATNTQRDHIGSTLLYMAWLKR